MRRFVCIAIVSCIFLNACSDIKKPSEENFAKAINQYLMKHGDACTSIGRQLPVEVPESLQRDQYGIGPELAALEQAGLVQSSTIIAVTPGVIGPGAPRRVRRYELTNEGRKYFRQSPGIFGQSGRFCHGQKTVDSIVKWTEPATTGAYSQAEVTYTYKILNLAGWAGRSDVQQAFPDVRTTISGTSKMNQLAGLQLTNQGWEVPGP